MSTWGSLSEEKLLISLFCFAPLLIWLLFSLKFASVSSFNKLTWDSRTFNKLSFWETLGFDITQDG